MTKQEIIEAIKVLAKVVKANSDEYGPNYTKPVVVSANAKIEELIKRL